MTISYNWLHNYLPETIESNELSHILTSVGLEVESMEKFETIKGGLEGLVIGKVMACEPHPNADKLRLTKVNIGQENNLSIVCGAPNVAVGQTVIVATIGTTIYPKNGEPLTMKKAKIRGEESEGMICAEDEIGMGESHDGILILPEGTTIGMLAKDYFKLPSSDIVYEIGLTPNRMDAMSHLGVAKDVCAYLSNTQNSVLRSKKPVLNNFSFENDKPCVEIIIDDTQKCARYTGVCIENITVKESPEWLQTNLKAIGVRPINNIVDITNYVLHECGHPLHAFDLKEIKGNKIVVKTVADKTKFIALDGKEITLSQDDLMICNETEPMCIAGVYGGLQSGVKNATTSIFLESAYFNSDTIRKTSMRHGMRTDAAVRFEKGANMDNVLFALQRATQLICEIAEGKISSNFIDVYPIPFTENKVVINYQKICDLAGKNYSPIQIKSILQSLNFKIETENEHGLTILVPFSNPDITMQADIVEEIMRIDGIDNIPFTGKIAYSLPTQTGYKPNAKQTITQQLIGKGFNEIFTNSITNASYYEGSSTMVKMMNSLSANLDVMRQSMMETGLEAIAYNLNRKNTQIKFFEFGKTYSQNEVNVFSETENLALYLSGNYRSDYYNEKPKTVDVFYTKGIVESLFPSLKIVFETTENGVSILFKNKPIGKIIDINKTTLKQFDCKQAVCYAEINWDIIKEALVNYKTVFTEIPKFPTMQRDLALIVSKKIKYNDIQQAIKQAKSKLLQNTQLFDVFENEKIGNDNISYAVNFSFYDNQKTLTDVEVETEMKNIINTLENKVGAVIRGN